MPCKDVTERIRVVVDAEDRLKDYGFSKRTCGQGIGSATLLLDHLAGLSIDDLLAWDAEIALNTFPIANPGTKEGDIEEFLTLKHFFAVQSALEVLVGREPGRKGDLCSAADISFDDGEMVIEALIDVDIVTDRIKSCGNCGSCGAKKKKKSKSALATTTT